MTQINLESAIVRLYEDISLTDEVDDATARIMHQWAEAQLQRYANLSKDPEIFEERFHTLRGILKTINLYAKRDDASKEKRTKIIHRIIERAREANYPPQLSQVAQVVTSLEELDTRSAVRALLTLVETGSTHAPGSIGGDIGNTSLNTPRKPGIDDIPGANRK
jgi:hypothetical protein